jgi:hypothetical protein
MADESNADPPATAGVISGRVPHARRLEHNNGSMILTGTADGLFEIGLDGDIKRHALAGTEVAAVSGDWAIADNALRSLADDRRFELPGDLVPRCLLSGPGGTCIIGTSSARLFETDAKGVRPVDSFDDIPERVTWSTPWGGPPDTRSLALGPKGILVNVHVGGVWRSEGSGWFEVVPAAVDVHQVVAAETIVAVAGGRGMGQSSDGGVTWKWSTQGMHAPYCRAVTIAADWLLATASDGPGAQRGAVYRRPLDQPDQPWVACGDGDLPKFFPYNVDTFELAAAGELVAVGTPSGELYLSEDSGGSWRRLGEALPGIRCVDLRT